MEKDSYINRVFAADLFRDERLTRFEENKKRSICKKYHSDS